MRDFTDPELMKLVIYLYWTFLFFVALGFVWIFLEQSGTRSKEQWKARKRRIRFVFTDDERDAVSARWRRDDDPWLKVVREQEQERRLKRENFWRKIFWWRR